MGVDSSEEWYVRTWSTYLAAANNEDIFALDLPGEYQTAAGLNFRELAFMFMLVFMFMFTRHGFCCGVHDMR